MGLIEKLITRAYMGNIHRILYINHSCLKGLIKQLVDIKDQHSLYTINKYYSILHWYPRIL